MQYELHCTQSEKTSMVLGDLTLKVKLCQKYYDVQQITKLKATQNRIKHTSHQLTLISVEAPTNVNFFTTHQHNPLT